MATIVLTAAGVPNVGRTMLFCLAVTLAAVTVVFVVMPGPYHVDELVLAVDALVLIAGAAAMIALPPAVMRSRWAALVVVIAIPAYLLSVFYGGGYLSYGWAWLRCLQQPVMVISAHTYVVPGDVGYYPWILSEYVCTTQEAEGIRGCKTRASCPTCIDTESARSIPWAGNAELHRLPSGYLWRRIRE